MRKNRSTAVAVCLVGISLVTILFAVRAQSPSPASSKTAAQEFKNIRVLKDIPADQLIPAMQFMSASLGVDCEYCHVERAFDKDDKKEKGYARHMIEMMMNINKDNFEGHREVTCYSCHRGVPKPISIPVISAEASVTEMMPGDAVDKSGFLAPQSILDKYLAVVGGASALEKVKSRTQKGIITGFGSEKMSVEIFAKTPDKRVSIVHRKEMDSLTGFDGKSGWMSVPGRVRPMNAQESEGARLDADLALPAHFLTMFSKLTTDEGEKVDGHDTWLVVGEREGKPPVKLFFDKQSGFLLREIRYADSPLGLNPLQIDFADYRDSGGVKVPHRWTQSRPGNRFTIQVDSSEVNNAIDDAKFSPPPSPARGSSTATPH